MTVTCFARQRLSRQGTAASRVNKLLCMPLHITFMFGGMWAHWERNQVVLLSAAAPNQHVGNELDSSRHVHLQEHSHAYAGQALAVHDSASAGDTMLGTCRLSSTLATVTSAPARLRTSIKITCSGPKAFAEAH